MTAASTYCILQSTRSDGTVSSDGIRVPKNGFYADISTSSFTGMVALMFLKADTAPSAPKLME